MRADIAQSGSAQQGVHDCMHQHVGIRVTVETDIVAYFDTAKDKPPPAREAMDIKPESRTWKDHHSTFSMCVRGPMPPSLNASI